MKAAFDNFLNGSSSPEALAETYNKCIKQYSNAVVKLALNILHGVVTFNTNITTTNSFFDNFIVTSIVGCNN